MTAYLQYNFSYQLTLNKWYDTIIVLHKIICLQQLSLVFVVRHDWSLAIMNVNKVRQRLLDFGNLHNYNCLLDWCYIDRLRNGSVTDLWCDLRWGTDALHVIYIKTLRHRLRGFGCQAEIGYRVLANYCLVNDSDHKLLCDLRQEENELNAHSSRWTLCWALSEALGFVLRQVISFSALINDLNFD